MVAAISAFPCVLSIVVILCAFTFVHNQLQDPVLVEPVFLRVDEKNPDFIYTSEAGNADGFVDQFLVAISENSQFLGQLKAVHLPDADFTVGHARNITLSGPLVIVRTGFSNLEFRGEELNVQLNLGVKKVKVSALYDIRRLPFDGRVEVILNKIDVGICLTLWGTTVWLEKLKIHEFAIEVTRFSGTAGLNGVNRWLINRFMQSFGSFLRRQIEKALTHAIRKGLRDLNLVKEIDKLAILLSSTAFKG